MRYLVTGASGFLGSAIVRRLVEEGIEVHAVNRPGTNRWRLVDLGDDIHEHFVDLRDADAVLECMTTVRPDVVYHCAIYGGYGFQQDAKRTHDVNAGGTLNLLSALLPIGVETVINIGSSNEYGLKSASMKEDDALEPVTVYGVSKTAATLYCQMFARCYEMPVVCLRAFSPYGPYEEPTRLVPAVISRALAGEDIPLSRGDEARDFTYIDDVVDLLMAVPSLEWSPGDVVNVASGQSHTVRQVALKVLELTASASEPLWGALPTRDYDTSTWVADVTKAKSLFGWEASTPLEAGLQKTIAWQRSFKDAYGIAPSRSDEA